MTDSSHTASDAEEARLADLAEQFMGALEHKRQGRVDRAEDDLLAILKAEPRLPEPRMELARIYLDTERVDSAEEHARLALKNLEDGGQWTDGLPENTVSALAHALVAESLRRRLDEDDVIFGDPDQFKALVNEAKTHFAKAGELDPSDEYSSYHAYFLGAEGHGGARTAGAETD
ncbi:MAG: hypothetical protein AB8H79_13690 [Myxococcota bacterium]